MHDRFAIAILFSCAVTSCAVPDPLQRAPLVALSGASVSLDAIEHNGHKDLAREVRDALQTAMALAPRHAVEWVEYDGAMRVKIGIIAVNRKRYTEMIEGTCRRVVPDRPVRQCDEDGNCVQVPGQIDVPCSQAEEVEDVSGRFKVQLEDGDGVRFQHQYHLSVTGTSFPLKLMARRLTAQIERLIVPWQQNPRHDQAAFSKKCLPASAGCPAAYRAFVAGNLPEAARLLTAELGPYADLAVTIPEEVYPAVAKVLCNRGLVREYQQSYDQALTDYRRAAVVAPNPKCGALLERLKNYVGARRAFGSGPAVR